MKKIAFNLLFSAFAFTSFSQAFSDTSELNEYIRDTIKDRRPAQISASQVQRALLGLSHFMGASATDVSGLHKTALLNNDGTKIVFYNTAGDSIGNVFLPHTDWYEGNHGLVFKDTLTNAKVISAGRLDTSWLSVDGIWRHNVYMSGAHDSTQLSVDSTGGGGSAVSSGAYTSTVTNILNVFSTSATVTMYWTKIDGIVHLSAWGNIEPNATGNTTINLTLPFSTSYTSATPMGHATIAENGGSTVTLGLVYRVLANTINLKYPATLASQGSYFITLDFPEL